MQPRALKALDMRVALGKLLIRPTRGIVEANIVNLRNSRLELNVKHRVDKVVMQKHRHLKKFSSELNKIK